MSLDNYRSLIINFFQLFGLESNQIKLDLQNHHLNIEIDLSESSRGIFIGRHARTLDSFQLLLSLILNNNLSNQAERLLITLDIGGYRHERYQRIIAQAQTLAEEALTEKLAKSMPQLSPTERRQIHLYFKDNEKITTYSQGEGDDRRLFIAPAA